MRISGVVLAAGRGERFGGSENKVWQEVAGRPLLFHALSSLWKSDLLDELVVVVRPGDEGPLEQLAEHWEVPFTVAAGGRRRQDSALAGVKAATGDYVLVHDGARPVVGNRTIRRVLEAAQLHGAAVPVVPVVDTLRYCDQEGYLRPGGPDRGGLVHIQTPQAFRRALLLEAYAAAGDEQLTDDAAALLTQGRSVVAVPGDVSNVKVTRRADLELVGRLLDPIGHL